MDHKNLDLSRFAKITAEEYCTHNWAFTEEEIEYVEELNKLNHYTRHLKGAKSWNLWACYNRDIFLEPYDEEIGHTKNLYDTNKQVRDITYLENEGYQNKLQ